MEQTSSFPSHGQVSCRRCFSDPDTILHIGEWQAVNDPGAWGSSTPSILVLGFSKGFTQANAFSSGNFNNVPFKGMRPRLTQLLRRLELLTDKEVVDEKFCSSETEFAFGSLVRCSLSRMSEKSGRRECTGEVVPKAFHEPVSAIVQRCAKTFLTALPARLKLVVMLGNGDTYMSGCKAVVQSIFGNRYRQINDVAYQTGGVIWIHVAHPSGRNGHFDNWVQGDALNKSGRKLLDALAALSLVRPKTGAA